MKKLSLIVWLISLVIVNAQRDIIAADTSDQNGINTTELRSIRVQVRTALIQKKYAEAVVLLQRLEGSQVSAEHAFALEFLGVAHERLGKFAEAKAYYQKFIAEHPDHPSKNRVEQRLAAVVGLEELGENRKLIAANNKARTKSKDFHRASLSVDYRTTDLVDDLGNRSTSASLMNVDVDLRADKETENGRIKYHLSAGQITDLEADIDETSERLRYAYLDWQQDSGMGVTFGRQRSRGKGIFGRFDGLLFDYETTEKQQASIVIGAPVASSRVTSIDPERRFVSLSYAWEDIIENLDISVFGLEQTIDSLTDRQAIGGEFRYRNDSQSYFGLLDYDVFYDELNALMISGSFAASEVSRFHWTLNQRKSPYISTRNALIGQTTDSLEELRNLFLTDEEILDLATDRTLESTTATIQWDYSLSDTFELSTNIMSLDLSGAPASGGVSEIVEPGTQTYYNVSLRGRNLYSQADTSQLGIRLSRLDQADVNSFYVQSMYRWSSGWSVQGRLRYDDRQGIEGRDQTNLSPSMRLQYQSNSSYLYLDLGAILYTNSIPNFREVSTDIYYIYLGYRHYFY